MKEIKHSSTFNSLVQVVNQYAYLQPDKTAFIYLADGLVEKEKISYAQLNNKMQQIAQELQSHAKPGDRILLCYTPGLDFICAFMACLTANMIAVPAFSLRNNRHAERLSVIMEDCQAKIILSTDALIERMQKDERFKKFTYIDTEKYNYSNQHIIENELLLKEDQVAFLQYTSGSTGNPKGVMVTHASLMHNLSCANVAFGFDQTDNKVTAFWIPVQHDMSLIGEILITLYVGGTGIMLSPTVFIERPFNWLKAIDRYRAHYAAAPNFAYDLCVDKINKEDKQNLDLSCWKVAMNASEPVRASTLQRFSSAFKTCGFDLEQTMPAYGLAEATLIISGTPLYKKPTICRIDKEAYAQGEFKVVAENSPNSIELVSSGYVLWADPEHKVLIVDPEKRTPCLPNKMGEIWIQSPSVAKGYWQKTEASEQTFSAYLADGSGPFLRTGDLGIMHEKELYITGRLKDIIIIQGRNLYPQDIESAVESCHPGIRLDCTAAFSIEKEGEEKLIIVAELERTARKQDPNEIFNAIRKAVIETTEIIPYSIQLLSPAQTFKTTSGKIQRQATKKAYLRGELKTIASIEEKESKEIPANLTRDLHNIYEKVLGVRHFSLTDKFSQLGGDSFKAAMLYDELSTYLENKYTLSLSVAFDYPTFYDLEQYIRKLLSEKTSAIENEISPQSKEEAIAIVGMSCRFPGEASDPKAFWQILLQGKETVAEIPPSRWKLDDLYQLDINENTAIKYGSFLNNIKEFDADFFNITPIEVETMDPQQRLLLETTWHALEDAGVDPNQLNGTNASVFIGATAHEYGDLLLKNYQHNSYITTGNTLSVLSGRVSYFFGLQGPSITLDTACSSSLVAVHEACKSLKLGETNLAIVGGVNALLSPDTYINLSQANMLSPDGHCKVFSQEANGYVRGEGCGVIILKRLSTALEDGANILAVIRGSVVNQDGSSSGLTVPNAVSQQNLLAKSLLQSQLQAEDIDYIEAHGTGTKLGDPMELHALGEVYKESHSNQHPLYIGSVKANIGHLESAAGMAGIIKVVLSLQHETIPPQILVNNLNSNLNLNIIPARISADSTPWPRSSNHVRRAGISSFGFSGTNSHIILEEAPLIKWDKYECSQKEHVLVISAKNIKSLEKQIKNYIDYLETTTDDIRNICYTSQQGRAKLENIIYVAGYTKEELLENLKNKCYKNAEQVADFLYPTSIKLQKVDLPKYAFAKQDYWAKNLIATQGKFSLSNTTHPLLGEPLHLGAVQGIVYTTKISKEYPDFILDHQVFDMPVVTGPAYISAIISAMATENNSLKGELRSINFYQPLVLTDTDSKQLQLYLTGGNEKEIAVESSNLHFNYWVKHATASYNNTVVKISEHNLAEKIAEFTGEKKYTHADLYDKFLPSIGTLIKGHSSWVEDIWIKDKEILAKFRLPGAGEGKNSGFIIHQGYIESCVYLATFMQNKRVSNGNAISYLPYAIDSLVYDLTAGHVPEWIYIEYVNPPSTPELFSINAYLLDTAGNVLLQINGLWLKSVNKESFIQNINAVDTSSTSILFPPSVPKASTENNYTRDQVQKIVVSCTSMALGISQDEILANLDKGFMDMGMDSLLAIELAKQLKDHFGESVMANATVLYNYSTVNTLSEYIINYANQTLPIVKVNNPISSTHEPVVIVGMSGRFPQAANINEFWSLLEEGRNGITDVPMNRWDMEKYYDPDPNIPGKICSRKGGFMNIPVDEFDAVFFGISPREATYMDPQQRLLLEVTWEALEDAGINPTSLKGTRTGVFVGIWASDYNQLLNRNGQMTDINPYTGLGSALAEAAGRISYVYGLQGPSIAIDTVCSSSLVALHQACESLQLGNCDTALVGGVNLLLDPATSIGFNQMHMLSPDGYCKTFDASANGYVRGEGCGVIVLKRLSDAQKEGDHILAVIKASGVNQDGASSGFTAPNGLAQQQLLSEVLAKSGVEASDINYIETHGTGTELGDPIEINAIHAVYSPGRDENSPLVLGAVKSNIGHLEAAAGVASLIKTVLALNFHKIPGNLHFTELNPKIDINAIPAIIPTKLMDWQQSSDKKRYAAISAFGATGTNAHIILEEAPEYTLAETEISQHQHLLVISAKNLASLGAQVKNYITFLKNTSEKIQNICYSSQVTRCVFEHKVAVIGSSIEELINKLETENFANEEEIIATQYPKEIKLKKVKLPHYVFTHKSYWASVLGKTSATDELAAMISASHCKLNIPKQGTLESIKFEPYTISDLKPDEVLVAIKATGVNLRDVLAIMGMYHGFGGEIGLECSGRVLAIGEKVTRFAVGDDVVGLATGGYADVVITKEDLMVAKPKSLSYEESATLPIAYLTAFVALMNIAKIRAGEKVLVHAAAGGVGLAAVHILKWMGAEIFATAGSDEKHNYLRNLGIKHVYHSRNTEFAQKILEDTEHQGVDIVLNSLTGEGFIAASLSCCAKNARFVEIGRVNIWDPEQVANYRDDIEYNVMQIDDVIQNNADKINVYLQKIITEVNYGNLPPLPYNTFDINEVQHALAYLQQARNIGKVIVTNSPIKLSQESKNSVDTNDIQSIHDFICDKVSTVLGIEPEELDETRGFFELGMDSLTAAELNRHLTTALGDCGLTSTSVFDYPNVTALIEHITKQLKVSTTTTEPVVASPINYEDKEDAIAIIGMSCRFPQAENVDEFWKLLLTDNDTISSFSEARKNLLALEKKAEDYRGSFISAIDEFDYNFFGISPREAEIMDPQQRILLEVSWEALENANLIPDNLDKEKIGVFIGAAGTDYGHLLERVQEFSTEKSAHVVTGTLLSALSGRISYLLGFQGPSLTVDTACSASLSAIHQACESLIIGDCDIALAGGVNIILDSKVFERFHQAGILSPSGACHTFDVKADGYVRGEGCGVIILKRVRDARRDNDTILAVIKGTGINQDGASSGFTVPNGSAQTQLMRNVLAKAKVLPETVSYIETHGTGTSLGDPIEVNAIGDVYGQAHTHEAIILGALKSHIGHLETASGVASLIKVVECLRHQAIPKNLHFTELNHHIDLNRNKVQLALDNAPWLPAALPRRAAISSFGFTGTNAHVILEEAPSSTFEKDLQLPPQHMLIISAKTPISLENLINKYIAYLKNTTSPIHTICYTSQNCRCLYEHKVAVLGESILDLLNKLVNRDFLSEEEIEHYRYPQHMHFNKTSIPTYAFERHHCWAEVLKHKIKHNNLRRNSHPLLGDQTTLGAMQGQIYTAQVSRDYPDFVVDHQVFDTPVISGPAFLSALLSAVILESNLRQVNLSQVVFYQPLAIVDDKSRDLQFFLNRENPQAISIKVHSKENQDTQIDSPWILHATAEMLEQQQELTDNLSDKISSLQHTFQHYLSKEDLYHNFLPQSGSLIRRHSAWIEELWCDENACLSRLRLPGMNESLNDGYLLHPGCIESCFYAAAVLRSYQPGNKPNVIYLPYAIDSITYVAEGGEPMWAYAELGAHDSNQELFKANTYLLSAAGTVVMRFSGVWLKLTTAESFKNALINRVEISTDKINSSKVLDTTTTRLPTLFDAKQIKEILKSQLNLFLGISQDEIMLHPDKGFMEMGMDSLTAVEIAKKLQSYFGEKIIPNATVLYNYPNLSALSKYIMEQYADSPMPKITPSTVMQNEPIAIIGMSGRYPGAANVEDFWKLLAEGKSGIIEVPPTRWDVDEYYDPNPNAPGKICSRNGGFLSTPIDTFDEAFFGMSPREAAYVDPQQRILLETTWTALEDAGINPSDLRGSRTGVYIGVWTSDYHQLLAKNQELEEINPFGGLGSGLAEPAGRISYLFGFQGPSVAIDTACSSSLVALHQACQGLQMGDCDAAIVGGVNLILDPATSIGFNQLHMLSPDGYCKTFDASANGYVRGEGCGIVVLKRLCDAKQDGDRILAVVRASGVNQDGASSGFTAPNGVAQEKLLREVLSKAHLSATDISFIETHGTGTELGDPIEVGALQAVYGEGRNTDNVLLLGALKTNIGHLESAAGIASLTKVVLALQHEQIPANLHFTQLNSNIDIDSIPAVIPTSTLAWPKNSTRKRYAAISAFGATGTNAHVIIEEAPELNFTENKSAQEQHLLVISAKTPAALNQQLNNYFIYLKNTQNAIQNICFTSQKARGLFEHVVFILGRTVEELINNLQNQKYIDAETAKNHWYPAETNLEKVKLPSYPFEPQVHWAKAACVRKKAAGKKSDALEIRDIEVENVISTTPNVEQIYTQDQIVDIVYNQVSTVLAIKHENLLSKMDKKFMEIGMDSLIAVELADKLKNYFGAKIIPNGTVIYDYPTINLLSQYINDCYVNNQMQQQDGNNYNPLLCLNAAGEQAPLFCVHGIDGHAEIFVDLAKDLQINRPIYAFQGQEYNYGIHFSTIEERAQFYISTMQTVQPHGPYYILGWSMGGAIALEITHQLHQQGEEIAFLGMADGLVRATKYDSKNMNFKEAAKFYLYIYGENITEESYQMIYNMDNKSIAQFIKELTARNSISEDEIEKEINMIKDNFNELLSYTAHNISHSVILFNPKEQKMVKDDSILEFKRLLRGSASNEWQKLSSKIKRYYVDGDHFSMLDMKHNKKLEVILQKYLSDS